MRTLLLALLLTPTLARAQETVEAVQRPDDVYRVVNVGPAVPITISSATTLTLSVARVASTATVTVVAGSGTAVLSSSGTALGCSIIPPSDSAAYHFGVVTNDADEFPIFGFARLITGKAMVYGKFYLVAPERVRIDDATVDGTYKVRCGVER